MCRQRAQGVPEAQKAVRIKIRVCVYSQAWYFILL